MVTNGASEREPSRLVFFEDFSWGLRPIHFDLEGDFAEDVGDVLAGRVRAGVADGSTARVGAERDREGLVGGDAGGFSDLEDHGVEGVAIVVVQNDVVRRARPAAGGRGLMDDREVDGSVGALSWVGAHVFR